jgi:uncharacterized membrane protein
MMAFRNLLVLIHLAAVIVWVGGMFFAHFCLRPVAAGQLAPPQRLPLLAAILGRFFKFVAAGIVLLWATGIARLLEAGNAAPWNWHAMAGIAALMTVIFGVIVLRCYPRLVRAVAAQDWPAGGQAMNMIRQLVLANLVLGSATVVIALWS